LGKALGFLVGALVLGTAFPHLLKSLSISLPWSIVLTAVSVMAVTGGALMLLFVPSGPYRKPMQRPDLRLMLKVFRPKEFRSAAFGYFGHMWELYTFWAFLPLMIRTWMQLHRTTVLPISITAFTAIGIGSIACVCSGYVSQKWGSRKTAVIALSGSLCCCLLSPLMFYMPPAGFIIFLLIWGWTVIADSPMFSTLVAQHAGVQQKGTALTITTCIGFSITIVSIETLSYFSGIMNNTMLYLLLAPGPLLGLIALRKNDPGTVRS
jgi:predicted MFS family arabinose efflux permease